MLTLAEIQAHSADPVIADGLASGNDEAVAKRLSELLTETRPVPINKIAAWAAANGFRAALQDHSGNLTSPLRSLSLAALDLLRGNMSQTFDTVAYAPMLDVMQQGGMFSAADRDNLAALATVYRMVTHLDVANALRGDQ